MDFLGIGSVIGSTVNTIADKFFMDAGQKEEFKLRVLEMQQQGELQEIEQQLSAIIAEAKSRDPWTSRARPMFLYLCYTLIVSAIPMGILAAFNPETAQGIIQGFGDWLRAIPEDIITLMGIGYLGYTGARTWDKTALRKK